MHTQKFLAMISTAALIGAGSLQAQSSRLTPDMEEKAREQTRQAIANLNGQSAAQNPPPSVSPGNQAVPAPMAWQVQSAPAPQGGLSPEMEMKVRAALHQAQADLDAKDKAAADLAAQTTSEKQAAAMAAQESIIREQVAAEKAKSEMGHKKADDDNAAANRAAAEAAAKNQSMAKTDMTSATPAVMVAGSKEQRLYDLLQLYKADKITPTEYHSQRAKIIAEPLTPSPSSAGWVAGFLHPLCKAGFTGMG